MSYQGVQPSNDQLNFDRMGAHEIRFTNETWWGAAVSLIGYTHKLWLLIPQPNDPIPAVKTLLTPASGYTITATQSKFTITEADLNALGLGPGTYPGCLLASNDGGTTTDTVWIGNFVVNPGWVTKTF